MEGLTDESWACGNDAGERSEGHHEIVARGSVLSQPSAITPSGSGRANDLHLSPRLPHDFALDNLALVTEPGTGRLLAEPALLAQLAETLVEERSDMENRASARHPRAPRARSRPPCDPDTTG